MTFQEELTRILDNLDAWYRDTPHHLMSTPEQAAAAITEAVLRTIGKDDRDYSHDNADEVSLKILVACSTACNELRSEIRTALTDKEKI